MLYRIVVNIFDVLFKIMFISYLMFPEPLLPDSLLFSCNARRRQNTFATFFT